MFDPTLLAGTSGGTLAIAYAAGCASGYGFAIRIAYRAVKRRLDKVEQVRRDDEQCMMICPRNITATEPR